jgi:chromosome partitioning protein
MIVAFAGQKGGSGKTTTAVAVAAEWQRRGKRVLLVDTDPQCSSRTWGEVATEAGHDSPTVVAMGAGLHKSDQLPTLSGAYDVTVVDCPPRHGEIQRAVLMVAELVVLPCGPSGVDAWALGATLDLITEARTLRPSLRAAVLITRKLSRTVLGSGAREALLPSGLPVLQAELGYRMTYQEALTAGLGVTAYAEKSQAADEVRALVDELTELLLGESHRAVA